MKTTYKLGVDQKEYEKIVEGLRPKAPLSVSLTSSGDGENDSSVNTIEWAPIVFVEIHHLDVGQGESTLITVNCKGTSTGRATCIWSALIDGGLETDGGGALVRLLHRLGINVLDAVIISHFDKDHFAGLFRVLTNVDHFYESESGEWVPRDETHQDENWQPINVQNLFLRTELSNVKITAETRRLAAIIAEQNFGIITIEEGDTLALDCNADGGLFKMTCIAANKADPYGASDDEENANSIAWLLEFGKYKYYTAGDLPSMHRTKRCEDAVADTLAGHAPLIGIKCGHHGAATSTSSHFLATVRPRVAFISAGSHARYGHPSTSTLARLASEPSVEWIVATNCMYDRPFLCPDYPENAQIKLKTLAIKACDAFSALALSVSRLKVEKLSDLQSWFKDQEKVMSDLVRSIEKQEIDTSLTNAIGDLLSDLGSTMAPERWGRKALFGLDWNRNLYAHAAKALRNLHAFTRDLVSVQNAMRRTAPLTACVAGSSTAFGNIVLHLRLEDAQSDDRVAFLGFHDRGKWTWHPLAYNAGAAEPPSHDYASAVNVEQLRDLRAPGSPAHDPTSNVTSFEDYTEKRARKRSELEPLTLDPSDPQELVDLGIEQQPRKKKKVK